MQRRVESKKRRKRIAKIIRNVIFVALLLAIGLYCYQVANNIVTYNRTTQNWKKSNKGPLAEMEPYMLYLSDEEYKNINEYRVLENSLFDKKNNDFPVKIKQKDIENLNSKFKSLPENIQNNLNKGNQQINNLWKIKLDFSKMYQDGKVKSTVNPKVLNTFIVENWNNLTEFLNENNSHYFNFIYNTVVSMSSDVQYVSNLFLIYNDVFITEKDKIIVKDNYELSSLINWDINKDKLQNKWEMVNDYLIPIVNNGRNILAKHNESIQKHKNFTIASERKASFDSWISQYKELKSKLVELPDFIGETKEKVEEWSNQNSIYVQYLEEESDAKVGTVIKQTPSKSNYNNILRESTIIIVLAKEKQKKEETKENPPPKIIITTEELTENKSNETNTTIEEYNAE